MTRGLQGHHPREGSADPFADVGSKRRPMRSRVRRPHALMPHRERVRQQRTRRMSVASSGSKSGADGFGEPGGVILGHEPSC